MSTQDIRIEGTANEVLTKLNVASAAAVSAGKCLIWRAVSEFICHRALRAAEVELNALDDRLLKDIGLSRGDIPKVVSGEFFADTTQARLKSARA